MRNTVFADTSLRAAVRILVKDLGYPLHHTTLHRWLTGFGEKGLDRTEWIQQRFMPSTAVTMAETGKQHGIGLSSILAGRANVKISPERYRSERRKDQLMAVAWILRIAGMLFGKNSDFPLWQWVGILLPVFHVVVWDFPCLLSVTAFQHVRPP